MIFFTPNEQVKNCFPKIIVILEARINYIYATCTIDQCLIMGGFLVAFIAKKNYIYNLKLTNFNKIKLIGFFICCNKHNISYRTTVIVFNTWVIKLLMVSHIPRKSITNKLMRNAKCACLKILLLKRPESGRDTYTYM